jgi:Zn ribbon nucleic-acid-binding protein
MSDTNCPYCEADIDINHDGGYGYEEDRIHEQECPKCEKNFAFTTAISFDYTPRKADCLNGGDHRFRTMVAYPVEYTKLVCKDCGLEKRTVNEGFKDRQRAEADALSASTPTSAPEVAN